MEQKPVWVRALLLLLPPPPSSCSSELLIGEWMERDKAGLCAENPPTPAPAPASPPAAATAVLVTLLYCTAFTEVGALNMVHSTHDSSPCLPHLLPNPPPPVSTEEGGGMASAPLLKLL